MKLNFKRNKAPKLPKKVTRAEYNDLVEFLNTVLIIKHNDLSYDFYELREELATNGVVRDLRKLEKEFNELRRHTATMITEHDRHFEEIERNGVASAINKLNAEIFGERKEGKFDLFARLAGAPEQQEVTLAGKVDAIIAHLGIDVSVKPQEVTPAQVVTTKVKAPAKKKGKR